MAKKKTTTGPKRETVVDLFCGCGGLSLGFLMAGFDVILGIDNDKASLETFKLNHPGAKVLLKDIENLKDREVLSSLGRRKADVVAGGPPCQGLSLSGPRRYNDPRNRLFLSFVRIARLLNPKAVLIENVPGLASLYGGRVKNEIIEEFSRLGYAMSVQKIVAADFGVPQTRERIFFVGLKNGESFRFPSPTHFPNGSLIGEKYITCREALEDLPPLNGDLGAETQKYAAPPMNEYQKLMREESGAVYNHLGTQHTEKVVKIISLVPPGGNYKDLPPEYKNSRNFHVAWTRYHGEKPAPTIDTGHRHHFHYKYNRVPTVRESARLQSFPDWFIFKGNKTEQYRQVGNAVPPLVAKALAQELKEYL